MTFRKEYLLISTLFVLGACKGSSSQSAASTEPTQTTATAQGPVDPATAGNITGTVKFEGTAPKMQKIAMNADAYCKTAHTTDMFAEDVVVNVTPRVAVPVGLDAQQLLLVVPLVERL